MNKFILIISGIFLGGLVGFGMQSNIWGAIGILSFFMFGLVMIKSNE